mmetsp:Transcript_22587/g.63024  ORF Transcript_22587/g.63024 Transcript_22587/m.63024 type:complete len:231 (-) Transcript_22587:1548-2240(-)
MALQSEGHKTTQNYAVAVAAMSIVQLPQGAGLDGMDFAGSPPRVSRVDANSPLADQMAVGDYCHGISMQGVDVVNLKDAQHLKDLIRQNQHAPKRELMLCQTPHYTDPCIPPATTRAMQVRSALYKILLPPTINLGFTMTGFPPYVHDIHQASPVHGIMVPHQTVVALVVPGYEVFNLQSGGFTSANLLQRLEATSHIEGRQLVLQEGRTGVRNKGSSDPMDLDGCCIIQ